MLWLRKRLASRWRRHAPTRWRLGYALTMRLRWPLTGRSEEMHVIMAALSESDVAGVVVHGVAGGGKSRLAREASNFASSTGATARWTAGTSSARELPLGAFASFIGANVGDTLD